MRYLRSHRKVFLWWSSWWAAQLVLMPELSLGIRLEPRRPMLDLYLGPLTLAIGRHPVLTDERTRHMDSCRGFLFADEPRL
jgi:hypothetical protein